MPWFLSVSAAALDSVFSLYHILRIWQAPAELSARLSAVNAETGMRRYNVRSYGHYTISSAGLHGGFGNSCTAAQIPIDSQVT